jgi:hypothetical protein
MNKQDTSFKDWSEVFRWASEGKPIENSGKIYTPGNDGAFHSLWFSEHLTNYSKHFPEKKKVKITLYRHWYLNNGSIHYVDEILIWDAITGYHCNNNKHLKTTIIEEFEYGEE